MDNQTDLTHDDNIGREQISSTSLPHDWRSHPFIFLTQACHAGDFETVRYILTEIREGPDLDDIKNSFSTDLLWACTTGYPDILTCLLEHGAPITNCATYAASIEDADTAIRIYDILFEHGLNLADYPGIVQYLENEKVLEYLLSNGADPNGLDDYHNVPLNICDTESTIKLLVDYGTDLSLAPLLHDFVCFPNHTYSEESCEFLLSVGVDINAPAVYAGHAPPGSKLYQDAAGRLVDGGTALHFLVRGFGRKGRPDVDPIPRMKWLLEHGANVDIKDDCGLTPLDYATEPAMIELLKSYQV
ncbi:ankyrin [Mollisia scopiformis]|uniref:Ankyrin n=1 Tax=Mollisia scopiformis TaxID=149040 RepID=A0A194WRQ0_MOLSC|nr:ankyrin [Mollisia scopiformis]KUJ10673.1 ankyrin [Mollisia scopiformis]